jgi:anti-sigma B factor antagonist
MMFSIAQGEQGEIILAGRFDASRVDEANAVFDRLTATTRVNFSGLEYISSAGLGVLLKTQKRLAGTGQALILYNMNKLIRDVFRIARFDIIFKIEE